MLLKQRRKLYRYEPGSPQINVLTGKLKELRRTVKLCQNIQTHSIEMEQRLQAARLEKQRFLEQQQREKQKENRRVEKLR